MADKVVDASILGAIIFEEPRADEANSLVSGFDLQAPMLLRYELLHIAQKKCLQYPSQRESHKRILIEALDMDIQWHEVDYASVLDIALETCLTTYDASYLWLARALAAPLATFDQQLQ
ncbi:MAG: type II toxin-antitoxin system VapC family toxin [Chloroflexi bacterium]|nr:type II toxin-antitoxin system VapC family toxin [Chloroflexota bacterium]